VGAQAVAPQVEDEHIFLWQVRSSTCTAFLLGSVHAAKAELFPLDPQIETAVERSEIVVFEADLTAAGSAAMKMLAKGTLEEGITLSDVLSEKTYDDVGLFLEERGMSISGFERFRPWFLALTLTALELSREGYSPDQGIDLKLSKQVKEVGKEAVYLETVDEQLEMFASLLDGSGDEFLQHTLVELETVVPMMERIFEAWQRGDAEQLEELMTASFEGYPDVFKMLVVDRNMRWLETIEKLLGGTRDFMVVVGSLHMVGEHGLPKQLENLGFSVEQR
jgi:uncharacterized protein YbaP (TraB family)